MSGIIGATVDEPIGSLTGYFKNPRKGNVPAIMASLKKLGQFKPIVVNVGSFTGRPNEILAGNHTWQAAKKLKWAKITVSWVDVDEDTAARIVLADNRTNDLATYDDGVLTDLLNGLPDVVGTGYEQADLDYLLKSQEPEVLPEGGDAGTGDDLFHIYGVVITCDSEDAQIALLTRLLEEGHDVKALSL